MPTTETGHLVVSRLARQTVVARLPDGRDITITILGVHEGRVRLGVRAPLDVTVHRGEIRRAIDDELRTIQAGP